MNHSIFQHFTPCFLLFVSHLDKNSSNAKTHTPTYGVSRKTMAAAESISFRSQAWWCPQHMYCVFNACAHKNTLSITTTPTQTPHSDVCTYCTFAISSKDPSLINMQSVIHWFALSFGRLAAEIGCKYSWKASDLYCQDKLENERISEGEVEFKGSSSQKPTHYQLTLLISSRLQWQEAEMTNSEIASRKIYKPPYTKPY